MSYVVGVSSGAFTVTGREEKMQLIGLYKKAQSSITKGVQFVQLDLESIAEFKEPNLEVNLKKIENMGITFGLHSETAAFGIQMAEPDSAIEVDYKHCHERLGEILEDAGKIGSKYILIHSSESTPFALLWREFQPALLVDFWGRPLSEFLQEKENKWLLDWTLETKSDDPKGKDYFWVEILRRPLREIIETGKERSRVSYKQMGKEIPSDEELEKEIKEDVKRDFLNFTASGSLHYGPERYAYYIIAKYMERENDPLWDSIIEANIKFFAKYEKKTPEQWLVDKKIEKVDGKKWSIDNENFRNEFRLWVPCVSAKYIWGHFSQDECKPSPFPDLKEKLKVKKEGKEYIMPLVLESPMAHRGIEEWLRLPNPLQFYYLAKEIGFEYIQLAFDLEHMISIRVDPETVVNLLPENGGEVVRVIHAGWPAALAPAHLPILLGSDQQFYLYKIYYMLRQKGFGKNPKIDHYIVFERGGPETFRESVISLRKIVEFLEKDIKPEELIKHPAFFGVATGEVSSYERQLTMIKEHVEEPLKGVIAIPEEEYTALGRAAMAKPGVPPEKWKKEELK